MKRYIIMLLSIFLAFSRSAATAQEAVADSTLGVRPTLKIENVSPAGHCDNQQLSFYAPWADHYEISKRRCDTAWIKDSKAFSTWFPQTLKPGVTGMIYKRLDEQGVFQFVVKAFKGNRYMESEIVTRMPCVTTEAQK